AGRVLRDAVHILMEGAPRGLTVGKVADYLRTVEGVVDLHHVNLWSICSHITAFSAHLEITAESDMNRAELLQRIELALKDRFHINHTTIQLVCTGCSGGPLLKELGHGAQSDNGCRH
ncbi:MAG: cation transporter, partial [Desulfuromonadales bacterium]|nr:cation transporter [Desulfuromonadales bacterium]